MISRRTSSACCRRRWRPTDVIVCAAGSLPGDLHKLWRARDPKGYHLEYGYSCMGYEIAGGLGVKMAAPDRDVYVLVGDGSYLMMAQEIVTAVQEAHRASPSSCSTTHGFASIGGLSESVGSGGFGTRYRAAEPGDRRARRRPAADRSCRQRRIARARRSGARTRIARAPRRAEAAAEHPASASIVVPVDRESRVGGYESWWDVPVAEVSSRAARCRRPRAALRAGTAQGARLSVIRVANAPCSWGALEFDAAAAACAGIASPRRDGGRRIRRHRARRLGIPSDGAGGSGGRRSARRDLALVAAFVPVALARADALDEGVARAVRTARLLSGSERA